MKYMRKKQDTLGQVRKQNTELTKKLNITPGLDKYRTTEETGKYILKERLLTED